jgi:hypothetical protein
MGRAEEGRARECGNEMKEAHLDSVQNYIRFCFPMQARKLAIEMGLTVITTRVEAKDASCDSMQLKRNNWMMKRMKE